MSLDDELDAKLRAIAREAAPGPSMADEVMRLIEQGGRGADMAGGELLREGDDLTDAQDLAEPAVRLVPDVPTELASGASRESHSMGRPPGRRHVRRLVAMCASKRVRWSVAAGVAAAVVLAIGFWPGKGGRGAGSAFAAAVGQFQKASTLVCQFSSPTPISLMGMSIVPSGKLYISAEHGTRFENYGNGVLVNVMIVPPEGPAVSITPPGRQYMVLTGVNPSGRSSQNGPDAFIRGLSKLSGQPDRELGKAVVGGVEAYGYEISAASLGFAGEPGAHSELWVDAQTDMPVRYVVEMPGFEEGKITTYIFDQFELNTPLDVELFDTAMPAGYTRVDTQMPAHDEATLIKGLGLYARQTGQYPSELSMARVVGGLIASGGANGAQPLTHQESLEVGAGVVFYMELAAGGRSPEYFGKTVLPGQKDAVLVRWKTEDGQWRVVYGDLRAETIGSQPQ